VRATPSTCVRAWQWPSDSAGTQHDSWFEIIIGCNSRQPSGRICGISRGRAVLGEVGCGLGSESGAGVHGTMYSGVDSVESMGHGGMRSQIAGATQPRYTENGLWMSPACAVTAVFAHPICNEGSVCGIIWGTWGWTHCHLGGLQNRHDLDPEHDRPVGQRVGHSMSTDVTSCCNIHCGDRGACLTLSGRGRRDGVTILERGGVRIDRSPIRGSV
jgi:hypothetical protein